MMTSHIDFPEDLKSVILSKLPVKSLIRFKCLNKFWYALLENPDFVVKHHENYNEDNSRLVATYLDSNTSKYAWSLFPDQTLADLSYQDISSEMPVLGQILGPYNGLFCLYENDRITLWNPAIREFRMIPKHRTRLPPFKSFYHSSIGFGVDPVIDDYKLVLVRELWDHKKGMINLSHVSMYNLGTNSWKDYEGILIDYTVQDSFGSTYLNGVYYWLAFQDDNHRVILAFEMGEEIFREIEVPIQILKSACATLTLHNGSLCLLLLNESKNSFEICMMNENCWTSQLIGSPLPGVRRPLGFWKDGALFIESNTGQLFLYYPSTEETRNLGLKTLLLRVYVYKESLISIKRNDDLSDIPWDILGV